MVKSLRFFGSLSVMLSGLALTVISASAEYGRQIYGFVIDALELIATPEPLRPSFSPVAYSAFSVPKVRAFLARVSERQTFTHAYRPA